MALECAICLDLKLFVRKNSQISSTPDGFQPGTSTSSKCSASSSAAQPQDRIDVTLLESRHQLCCISCGHVFHVKCLANLLAIQKKKSQCPICRMPAKENDIRLIYPSFSENSRKDVISAVVQDYDYNTDDYNYQLIIHRTLTEDYKDLDARLEEAQDLGVVQGALIESYRDEIQRLELLEKELMDLKRGNSILEVGGKRAASDQEDEPEKKRRLLKDSERDDDDEDEDETKKKRRVLDDSDSEDDDEDEPEKKHRILDDSDDEEDEPENNRRFLNDSAGDGDDDECSLISFNFHPQDFL